MQVTLNKKGMILLVELKGRLDTSTPKEFEAALLDLIESGETHLVFDFSQVEQVSASGLRVLVRAFKQVTYANGRMVFHSLNERVKRLFEITGLTMVFRIYETREEAVAGALFTGMLPVNILRKSDRHFTRTA
jgi:anti-sigma B factor antagonist